MVSFSAENKKGFLIRGGVAMFLRNLLLFLHALEKVGK